MSSFGRLSNSTRVVILSNLLKNSTTRVHNKVFQNCRYISSTVLQMAQTRNHIKTSVKDGIGIVRIDSPNAKVNTLSRELFPEFTSAFEELAKDSNVTGIVLISGKTTGFIAGADINMLEACQSQEELYQLSKQGHKIMNEIEKSTKPVVAAIMGPALGGGLEVALACHYRIAVNDRKTVVGLPEVMLGLLPGSGGTQRLPKLVTLPNALDMMLTGRSVRASKAKSLGIVDLLVEPLGPGTEAPEVRTLQYLEEAAIATAKKLKSTKVARKKDFIRTWTEKILNIQYARDYVFKSARGKVMGQTKGLYPAPLKILDVIKTGLEKGREEGYEAEAKGFAELGMTSECRALINIFHGQTACKKNRFGPPKTEAKNVAVLGAGLMGAGIAAVSIDKAGCNVFMKDMNKKGLSRGYNQVLGGLNDAVKKKKLSKMESDIVMSRLTPQITYDNFEKADIIIEAVFEDLNIKHRVLKEVEKVVSPNCIFASNTSALPIADIASASSRPEKVIGMHYFSPVEKMPLLEIIVTPKTSTETISAAVQLGLKQGKVVIVVKDCPGFYTTRVLALALAELFNLFQEGVDPKEIDKACKGFGFPVGSATLLDEVGVDVAAHIAEFLEKQMGERAASKAGVQVLNEMVKNGFLGRKSGKGVFVYQQGVKGSDRPVNDGFVQIINKFKAPAPGQIKNDTETIQWRLATKFVNESVRCLQEEIINSPTDGDIGAVFGLGFPPMKGGPFKFVDTYGADRMVEKLKFFEQHYGAPFTPCELLLEHAKDKSRKFYKK